MSNKGENLIVDLDEAWLEAIEENNEMIADEIDCEDE